MKSLTWEEQIIQDQFAVVFNKNFAIIVDGNKIDQVLWNVADIRLQTRNLTRNEKTESGYISQNAELKELYYVLAQSAYNYYKKTPLN